MRLGPLMELTSGAHDIRLGLIDGPVASDHPHFAAAKVRGISSAIASACSRASSEACTHGTLVAGVLIGRRDSGAPAICPGCTLLVRPVFLEARTVAGPAPVASMEEVAAAIVETVDAGARVLNLSVALAEPSSRAERGIHEALDYAARHGVIVVAAAGNQGALGSSAITRHPWVIPVIACDLRAMPTADSNLSHSTGRRGLAAPGEGIRSLAPEATLQDFSGTSAAVPFVTGAIGLLWSLFPGATPAQLRYAVVRIGASHRSTVVPPLLNGWGAYQWLSGTKEHIAR